MSLNYNNMYNTLKRKKNDKTLDASITVRVDGLAKKEFEEICNKMGMTVSSAINAFIDKVINLKALPFNTSEYKRERNLFIAEEKFNISDDVLLNDDISELFDDKEY